MIKRIYAMILALIICMIPLDVQAKVYKTSTAEIRQDMSISLNGEVLPYKPAVIDGKTYIPLRIMAYLLNSTVSWDSKTRTIGIYTKDTLIQEPNIGDLKNIKGKYKASYVDDMNVYINGNRAPGISSKICVIKDRTYLPIRALTLVTDTRLTYNEDTKNINIVNPRRVQIDNKLSQRDVKYYVYDLPNIQDEGDYLVGNWSGKDVLRVGLFSFDTKSTLHISRQSDGLYTVISYVTIEDLIKDDIYWNFINDPDFGPSFVEELINGNTGISYTLRYFDIYYNKETKELELRRDKCETIQSDIGDIGGANIGPILYGDYLRADYPDGTSSYYTRY